MTTWYRGSYGKQRGRVLVQLVAITSLSRTGDDSTM